MAKGIADKQRSTRALPCSQLSKREVLRNEDKAYKRKSKHGIRDGSTVLQISTMTVLRAGRADSLDLFEIRQCGELRSNICSLATGFANCRPNPSRRRDYSDLSGRQATHIGQPMNSHWSTASMQLEKATGVCRNRNFIFFPYVY
jgi:hypothetical protein